MNIRFGLRAPTELPLKGHCAATSSCVTKGSFRPEADLVIKGGKRSFAADANVRTDFRKADVHLTCRDVGSTNGCCVDKVAVGKQNESCDKSIIMEATR